MSQEISQALGAGIREKRSREGLSLRDAALASGIAFSTLARIEGGANPSLKVDRLARAWIAGETAMLPTPAMTLRDWFAGQALAANFNFGSATTGVTEYARHCYNMADAMLAARTPKASS